MKKYTEAALNKLEVPALLEIYNENTLAKTLKRFASVKAGVARVLKLQEDIKEANAAAKAEKAAAKAEKAAKPSSRKYSLGEGFQLFKVLEENPRRPESHGWHTWNALADGMTYIEAIDAGCRNQDLRWDIRKGWVEIRDAEGNVVDGLDVEKAAPKAPKAEAPEEAEVEVEVEETE
tara:strand:+ start:354 stop:884 length:531 start_codon:yes stop_codon:yes gene_type:complete